MCMSTLSNLIQDSSSRGFWNGTAFNNQTPRITHMSFVDDLVIFGETTFPNLKNMLDTVDWFCKASGR